MTIIYSHEINKILNENDQVLPSDIYVEICSTSPQITQVRYNKDAGFFEIWTNDGYYFQFSVYRKDQANG